MSQHRLHEMPGVTELNAEISGFFLAQAAQSRRVRSRPIENHFSANECRSMCGVQLKSLNPNSAIRPLAVSNV